MKKIMMAAIAAMIATPAMAADWKVSAQTDEFTGERQVWLHGDTTLPTKKMEWPYSGYKATITYSCVDKQFYIATKASNLKGGTYGNGNKVFTIRSKVNDKIGSTTINQTFGEDVLWIDEWTGDKIKEGNQFIIQLPHYGGDRVWKFDISEFDESKCN